MSFVFPRPNRTIAFSLADAAKQSVRALRAARDAAAEAFDDAATIVMNPTVRPEPRRTQPPKARRTMELSLPSVILAPEVWENHHRARATTSPVFVAPFTPVHRPPPPQRKSRLALCLLAVVLALASLRALPLVGAAVDKTFGGTETIGTTVR